MRHTKTAAVLAIVASFAASGCSTFRDRTWGECALAGAVIGGAGGGTVGGVAVNNAQNHASNEERGAGIGGGLVAGALIGAVLGHAVCDPIKAPPPPPPAPAQAAPAPPPPAKGTTLATLGATNFDFNKATVKPEGREIVASAVKTLKDNPDTKVVVEGHTDSIGSDAYNQKLSLRRANAVRDLLVHEGIDAARIRTEGLGKSHPIADNKTAEGRAKNRRAEIVVD